MDAAEAAVNPNEIDDGFADWTDDNGGFFIIRTIRVICGLITVC